MWNQEIWITSPMPSAPRGYTASLEKFFLSSFVFSGGTLSWSRRWDTCRWHGSHYTVGTRWSCTGHYRHLILVKTRKIALDVILLSMNDIKPRSICQVNHSSLLLIHVVPTLIFFFSHNREKSIYLKSSSLNSKISMETQSCLRYQKFSLEQPTLWFWQ